MASGSESPRRRRHVALILLAIGLALPGYAVLVDEPFLVTLATRIVVLAVAAVSLDLILGYGGLVSFGHAAFVGIGAYAVGTGFFLDFNNDTLLGWDGSVDVLLIWPLGVLVAALVALAIGAISLRTRGIGFSMITLVFSQMLFVLVQSLRWQGDDSLALWGRSELPDFTGLDLNDTTTFYYVALACLVGFTWLCSRLVDAPFGRILQAGRQNEKRMRALGVAVDRHRLAAFVIAGAGGGLSGVLLANAAEFVGPAYLAWNRSGELIVMVVLGGMGTLVGPIIGAGALVMLEEYLAQVTEHWQIVLGPVLLLAVLFARRGILGLIEALPGDWMGRLRRWRARRSGDV